jgi:intracellular sulfur oxidation DsrE/DsrF family protein
MLNLRPARAASAAALILAVAAIAAPQAAPARVPHGKLVFVLTTGFEDLQTANMMFKQARIAKESGYLEEVAVLAYGRGVQLFEQTGARPAPTAGFIRAAQQSGVKFIVCNNALTQLGIPVEKLDPKPNEIVPQGIVKLSQMISEGYQAIRY